MSKEQLFREIYEVWAGSEGIPEPETCTEAYLLRLIEQMRDLAKKGMKKHMTYPTWICNQCGTKYGRKPFADGTSHMGQCDVCGKEAAVTEPRDYGHLKEGWQEHTGEKND